MADPITISILDTGEFIVTQPFAEGHTCSAADAKVLNQTRRENLGNNFRAKVRAYLDATEKGDKPEFTLEQLQAQFAELDASYVFTLANTSTAVKYTPEEKEARIIAKEFIKTELDKAGRKLSTPPEGMSKEDWDDAIENEIDRISKDDEVVKLAKATVKARTKGKEKLALAIPGLGSAPAAEAQ